jgi:hypothetical protein
MCLVIGNHPHKVNHGLKVTGGKIDLHEDCIENEYLSCFESRIFELNLFMIYHGKIY